MKLSDVFVEDKGNANDGALRFALDLISSRRRFVYFADRLLRPKVLKGAPFATNLVKALCRDTLKVDVILQLGMLNEPFFARVSEKLLARTIGRLRCRTSHYDKRNNSCNPFAFSFRERPSTSA